MCIFLLKNANLLKSLAAAAWWVSVSKELHTFSTALVFLNLTSMYKGLGIRKHLFLLWESSGYNQSVIEFRHIRVTAVYTQLQSDCWHDQLYERASLLTMFKICEMCYLGFKVFVSDMTERQLKCLQAVIPGARHAQIQCFWLMIIARAVPERTKHSCKTFIIVYVWLNNGSTPPAAQAPVHRQSNRGWQAHRLQWLVGCCFYNRRVDEC